MLREAAFKLYWKMQHIIAPRLQYSQSVYEDVLNAHVTEATSWLDLGCGHQLLPNWRSSHEKYLINRCETFVGIDYSEESLKRHRSLFYKAQGDLTHLPIRDTAFNLITANMVVEHLDKPEVQFHEIYRVLKPKGLFIFHTPNIYGYTTMLSRIVPEMIKDSTIAMIEGRREEDVFPTHYLANTEVTIRKLAERVGFSVCKIRLIVSSAQFVVIPPLVFLELFWIRMLMTKPMKRFRTNIIAILQKS